MDFFHCPIKIISRNTGRSAVAASAYISGTRLENTWDGTIHDYTRKQHVIYTEMMLPENAPPEYADRKMLWNSVEWNEQKRNAQLARSVELALPNELTHEQNIALIRKFVQDNFVSKGMCADVAFHDKGDGNPHVHILLTMRALDKNGKWMPKSRLVYDLDEKGERIPAKQPGRWKTHKENTVSWDDRGNAELWRAQAAQAINEALREAGHTQGFVDHRSYVRQGIERIPTIHEGPDARAMEKRGIPTEVGNRNRDIREQNKLLNQLQARLTRLNEWAQYEKKMDEALSAEGKDVSNPNLRYLFAARVLETAVPRNQEKRRLQDAFGIMVTMNDYHITDAVSYAEAVKQVNAEFYDLQSRRKKNNELSAAVSARLAAHDDVQSYRRYANALQKLPEEKRSAFGQRYTFELRKYREAEAALKRWEAAGERMDPKGWRDALTYLNKERFMMERERREVKESVHRLELVKRAFVREKKREGTER